MRVTTAFKRLLRLPGVDVTAVEFGTVAVVVVVALRRRRLAWKKGRRGCRYTKPAYSNSHSKSWTRIDNHNDIRRA